jgi:ABC-type nitrate/sulfonate/bicarbonate transport system substrate-binding protein
VYTLPARHLSHLAPLLAQALGFFEAEGLDVQIVEMESRVAQAGLLSGEVGYDGRAGANLFLAARTGQIQAAMFLQRTSPTGLVAQPGLRTIGDLRGGRVYVSGVGTAGHVLARAAIRRGGLDPNGDLDIVYGSSDAGRIAALESNQAQAIAIAQPIDTQLTRQGNSLLADAVSLGLRFPVTGVVVARTRFAERPDEVRRVLRAVLRAQAFTREQPDAAAGYAAELTGVDRDLARGEVERLIHSSAPQGELSAAELREFFELHVAEGQDIGLDVESVRFADLYEYTPLRQARADLGR